MPATTTDISILNAEHRTERANAQRFVKLHGTGVRYVPAWQKWLAWNRTRWALNDGFMVEARAKHVADAVWDDVKDELPNCEPSTQAAIVSFARQTSSARGIAAMLTMARSEPSIAIQHHELDSDPWLLNVRNGTLDLRTGTLRKHDPADLISKMAPVEYFASATCPTWQRLLDEIFASDIELIQFVRRFLGMALTGICTEHVLPFCYGTGANGKSTLIETVLAILGDDYSMKAPPDLLMAKTSDSHPTERADLFGKRLVVCNEIEQGCRLNEALVKDLTGGDSIRARRMREDFWQFAPTHKLILCGNHKPQVRGTDNGIWRRLRLIPFGVTFPLEKQDKHLREKLLAESSGILAWLVDACGDWQTAGLGTAEAVNSATGVYRDEQDTVGQFVAERCIEGTTCKVRLSDLRADYEKWCKENGEYPLGGKRFSQAMTERGYRRYTNNGTWFQGIETATDFE